MALSRRGEGAASCLRFDERPETPREIRKFRKSYFEAPGARSVHPGQVDDAEALRERLAGTRLGERSSRSGSHVADIFAGGPKGSLSDFVLEKKESIYRTVQREPLGKPYVRGHDINQADQVPNNNSNKKQPAEGSAKDLIYSSAEGKHADTEHTERIRAQYRRSHNAYEPGEQKRRNYNWHGEDPSTRRFGSVEMKKEEGVAICIRQPDDKNDDAHHAVVKHRAMTTNRLGAPKYRGLVDADAMARFEQNIANARVAADSSARDCIQGNYSLAEQQPDADLGRSIRPGWRNLDTDRVFGAPTVRNDIPAPATRSVTDDQNYGDDTNAAKLLFPSPLVALGVDEADFNDARDPEDVRDLMARIGHEYSDDDFIRLYRRAFLLATGSEDVDSSESVSLRVFLDVHNDYMRCLDEGIAPSWW